MNAHEFLDEDLRETAALYVLGSLDETEARGWRLHLVECDVCRREVDSLFASARELVRLAPVEAVPADLWTRVLERVRKPRVGKGPSSGDEKQVWKTWRDSSRRESDGFSFHGAQDGGFEPTGFEGVEARQLFVDAANDRVTMMVRMKPGSSYPGHVHAGNEECFVVSGDLRVGDLHMKAGDYQRAEAGSRHVVQKTDHGCVLLLVSSMHDELTD
jgi:anti-sigma factor ChrR (cupin superfamily)